MKLHFSGTHYDSTDLRCFAPGDYEVSEAKATQVLADFPDQFSMVEPVEEAKVEVKQEEKAEEKKGK